MKKFLVLLLVLGMTSMANAIVLEISVNGEPAPPDSQISLFPSDELILDIYSTSGHNGTSADDTYWVIASTSLGTVSGGTVTIPPAPDASSVLGQSAVGDLGYPGPDDGPWGFIGTFGTAAVAPGTYIDNLLFHCEGEGDAIVTLYLTTDFATYEAVDRVIIHQIPEPMTVALLGMGGLFLLRRRK